MTARFRDASVEDVSYGKREITLIAVPYDRETIVNDGAGPIREKFLRSAFDDIETRAGKVTVNRDHSRQRVIGLVKAFYPRDSRGLVATCKIAPTELGLESLQLAYEGVLRASVAFRTTGSDAPVRNGLRTVTRAQLQHIALTPEPAYEDAEIIDIRTVGPLHTPNLDIARALLGDMRRRPLPVRW